MSARLFPEGTAPMARSAVPPDCLSVAAAARMLRTTPAVALSECVRGNLASVVRPGFPVMLLKASVEKMAKEQARMTGSGSK